MKEFSLVSVSEIENRKLLWDVFINYIETLYFSGAIEKLDKNLIVFEFENYKAYYLN
jgi:hypothetical protein